MFCGLLALRRRSVCLLRYSHACNSDIYGPYILGALAIRARYIITPDDSTASQERLVSGKATATTYSVQVEYCVCIIDAISDMKLTTVP